MPLNIKGGLYDAARIVSVSVSDIFVPATRLPKRIRYDDEDLTRSISRYGVLQPISVRKKGTKYELISGMRRLRSAKRAGLTHIPCIILNVDSPEGELIALTENLQRRDLDFVEEAEELYRLVNLHNFSQEEAARRIGRSQPAVANKLRLLRLPQDVLYALRDAGLTERHARELLRLGDRSDLREILAEIIKGNMNVADTQRYIDSLLAPPKQVPERIIAIGDTRMFLNTVNRGADMMRQSGFIVDIDSTEEESITRVAICITKPDTLL